ncbi:MAG TPA: sulfite exporter TauE/SafE family protein, partial [Methylophaga aminisulfidivorans]|nr:sulfite exporter TauE/SafE family protein [Methylophaga aminisulfidivorans]
SVRLLLKPVILLYGAITGVISAMVGIGGGTFIVPYLVMSGLSIQKAVGTAAACGFPIAVSGIITYMIIGQAHQPVTTSWQTGFVNWQAFIGIVSTSIWMAPVGAKIATKLSATLLSRLFSVLLLFIGVMFIMR